MTEHRMLFGNHWTGGTTVPFAKCSCGAEMTGDKEIEQHKEERDG